MLHPFNLRLLLHKLFLNAYCPLHHCFLSHSGSLITVTFICLFSFIAACNSSVLPPLCALSFFPQLRYYTLLSICFFPISVNLIFLPAHSILSLLQAKVSVKLQVYAAPWRWQQFPRQQQVAGVSAGIAWAVDGSTHGRYCDVFLFAVKVCGEAIAVC